MYPFYIEISRFKPASKIVRCVLHHCLFGHVNVLYMSHEALKQRYIVKYVQASVR